MADISKIKLANGSEVMIKDKTGRENFATLLGEHALQALGTAAWQAYQSTWDATKTAEVPSVGAVKSYVDAQIETIPTFDVVIDPSGTESGPSVPASKDTFHKIYLTPAGKISGTYVEWLTIRSGSAPSYTYAWEKIGTTEIDLTNYVQKTRKVAGIDLQDDITVAEMQVALGLGNMAYADTASGEDTVDTIDTIEMSPVTVAGDATVTFTETTAALTKADYTPAGSVTGTVVPTGTVDVQLQDSSAQAASLTKADYTPAGTVTAKANGGSFAALTSAVFQADSANGVQITGSVSKPDVALTSTTQAVVTGVLTSGTVPSYEHTGFEGGSLSKGSAVSACTEGIVASVGTGSDAETLIFSAAGTDEVMDYDASFNAAVYGTDTFNEGAMPTFSAGSVNNVTSAALAAAPVFTGGKYSIDVASDTALKEVEFTGTKETNALVTAVSYVKSELKSATFTGNASGDAINAAFAGTKVENALVTAVKYQKADAAAAFSETVTPAVSKYNRTAKTIEITATPDA